MHLERRLLRNRRPGCGADADPVGKVRHEDPAVIGRAREPPVDARRHVDGLIGQVARQVVDRRAPERVDGRRRKGPGNNYSIPSRHRQVLVSHGARVPAAAELVHFTLVTSVIYGVAEERAGDGSHARECAQVELHQHEIDIGPAGGSVVRGGEAHTRVSTGADRHRMRPLGAAADVAEPSTRAEGLCAAGRARRI